MIAVSPPVLMPGEIIGEYELLSLLSNHNGSEVWLCASRRDGILHVLKRFALTHPRIAAYRQLYLKLQRVDCPFLNLPECCLEDPAFGFCILSPFHKAGTLKRLLKENGALPLGPTVHLLKCMLQALAALHTAKIIHRDVKPGNIYLTDAGDAKLGDFGIAKIPEMQEKKKHFIGSIAYASPEQALSALSAGPGSDLFSLGSVIYEVATGKARFSGNDFAAVFNQVVSDRTDLPFDELIQYIPDSLASLLCGMMVYDRYARAADAAKLLANLEKLHLPESPLPTTSQNV